MPSRTSLRIRGRMAAKRLVGEQTAWRIRVGDYRVIYDVFDGKLTVTVIRAAHRREVYNRKR